MTDGYRCINEEKSNDVFIVAFFNAVWEQIVSFSQNILLF